MSASTGALGQPASLAGGVGAAGLPAAPVVSMPGPGPSPQGQHQCRAMRPLQPGASALPQLRQRAALVPTQPGLSQARAAPILFQLLKPTKQQCQAHSSPGTPGSTRRRRDKNWTVQETRWLLLGVQRAMPRWQATEAAHPWRPLAVRFELELPDILAEVAEAAGQTPGARHPRAADRLQARWDYCCKEWALIPALPGRPAWFDASDPQKWAMLAETGCSLTPVTETGRDRRPPAYLMDSRELYALIAAIKQQQAAAAAAARAQAAAAAAAPHRRAHAASAAAAEPASAESGVREAATPAAAAPGQPAAAAKQPAVAVKGAPAAGAAAAEFGTPEAAAAEAAPTASTAAAEQPAAAAIELDAAMTAEEPVPAAAAVEQQAAAEPGAAETSLSGVHATPGSPVPEPGAGQGPVSRPAAASGPEAAAARAPAAPATLAEAAALPAAAPAGPQQLAAANALAAQAAQGCLKRAAQQAAAERAVRQRREAEAAKAEGRRGQLLAEVAQIRAEHQALAGRMAALGASLAEAQQRALASAVQAHSRGAGQASERRAQRRQAWVGGQCQLLLSFLNRAIDSANRALRE